MHKNLKYVTKLKTYNHNKATIIINLKNVQENKIHNNSIQY
jgi:hypothetical protein